jgi:hypothetical protein
VHLTTPAAGPEEPVELEPQLEPGTFVVYETCDACVAAGFGWHWVHAKKKHGRCAEGYTNGRCAEGYTNKICVPPLMEPQPECEPPEPKEELKLEPQPEPSQSPEPPEEWKLIKTFGFELCPWMKEPAAVRYPRVHTSPFSRTSSMYECMAKLAAYQERGDFMFVPFGGIGVSAMTNGGFHGNGDDGDIDLKSVSRIHESLSDHCSGVGPAYGFEYWPKPENQSANESIASVAAMHDENKSSAAYQALPGTLKEHFFANACVCEWEGLSLLCLHDDAYWVYEYGKSYWVPPAVSGGKDTGDNFKDFMAPGSSYEDYFCWLVDTIKGLSTVDTDEDGVISAAEFLAYLRPNPKINQLWLNRTMVEQPCVVYNAAVHYNHTYAHGRLAMRLREQAGCKLTDANWETYDAMWQDIVYLSDEVDGERCAAFFSGPGPLATTSSFD